MQRVDIEAVDHGARDPVYRATHDGRQLTAARALAGLTVLELPEAAGAARTIHGMRSAVPSLLPPSYRRAGLPRCRARVRGQQPRSREVTCNCDWLALVHQRR
jgi:hypothetical protein